MLQPVDGRPLPCPSLPGALAGDVAEGPAEGPQAAPPGLEGDLGDRQLGVPEQGCGPLDAPGEQIPCGGTQNAALNDRAKWASETPLTRASRATGQSSWEAASMWSLARRRRRRSWGPGARAG